jgi:hypothetical protein
VERALLKQVQLNEAAMWSNPMAKAANISNSNSGQPDKNRHDPDRASEGKSERKKNLTRQPTSDPKNADEIKTPGSGRGVAAMKTATLLFLGALAFSTNVAWAQTEKGLPNDPRPAASSASQPRDTTGMAPNKSGRGTSTSGGADANGDQGRDAMPESNKRVKPLSEQHKPRE